MKANQANRRKAKRGRPRLTRALLRELILRTVGLVAFVLRVIRWEDRSSGAVHLFGSLDRLAAIRHEVWAIYRIDLYLVVSEVVWPYRDGIECTPRGTSTMREQEAPRIEVYSAVLREVAS